MPMQLELNVPGDDLSGLRRVLEARRSGDAEIMPQVEAIIAEVRERGDDALRDYTARFDGHRPQDLRLGSEGIAARARECPVEVHDALGLAIERIRAFHERVRPAQFDYVDESGVRMGYRYRPMAAAGVYVPGGCAAYPSSVLMNCLPAQIAGVKRLVLCTPTPNCEINPAVLEAIRLLELDEVYLVGGAQAIAAMAYGTETIPAVDFIAGPGNAYVRAAKRAVFGTVGIDSLAGPSEVSVVADSGANPRHVALDLLAQAEHDSQAQAILISDDAQLISEVKSEVAEILQNLPRAEIAGSSWANFGATILLDNLAQAPKLVDVIAPEHLILAVSEPEPLFAALQHAGSVFLGYHSPEALGDYLSGPNHVLPTSGSARYASGLSTASFMKRISFQQCDPAALVALAPAAMTLARAEGLEAHALSLQARIPGNCPTRPH